MAYGSHELHNEAEHWKEEYTHASQSRDFYEGKWKESKEKYEKLSSEFDAIDGAAEYWKNEFEMLYNRMYDLITTDSDMLSDGECIDAMWEHLESIDGQSDEQKCTKTWNTKN